ncbi:MAG: hypothetical protein IKZ39_02070 [Lachnospiraceae bacterium]|nr:hypothetical protein [Lachnospiraceae bacterium]MBR6004526.1 hypothetical protein [Lachnospiraceae bacterium]
MATKSRLMAYANGVKKLTDKETNKANKKTSVLSNLAKEKAKKEGK